jgi:S-adenosylmethionine decarboxylase
MNIYQSNIFHTKMMVNEINLSHYLFNVDPIRTATRNAVHPGPAFREMLEIFYGTNIYSEESR